MNRIESVNRRYAASASLLRTGIDIFSVSDPIGARFNSAVSRLLNIARDDGSGLWNDVVGAARMLRWRLLTQPQPLQFNVEIQNGIEQLSRQVKRMRGAAANETLLDDLLVASQAITEAELIIGKVLIRSIEEVGSRACFVVAASTKAREGLRSWLSGSGVIVLTAGELERERPCLDQAYVIGPPRYFHASLVTAPITDAVSFLIPSWFGDRSIPQSVMAPYAEGAIKIVAHIFNEGEGGELGLDDPKDQDEEDFMPQIVWSNRPPVDREPSSKEVLARKVLLSGNLALWLDEGDRIRILDPSQPVGERVTHTEVSLVQKGTYLLLRKGETEHGVLYQAALGRLGSYGDAAEKTQMEWKTSLTARLVEHGYSVVERELRQNGIKTIDRIRAWTDQGLVRPRSDSDFEILLKWLGMPIHPTLEHATELRRALYQASSDVREKLEKAIAGVDLAELERDGHLALEGDTEGIRGMIATRVLAISPYTEIVPRYEARVPFEDWSGRWLG